MNSPSIESLRNMAAFVRQIAAETARLGTPQRTAMEVSFPADVDALVAPVSDICGLTSSFVMNALIEGFYEAIRTRRSEMAGIELKQVEIALRIEQSKGSVQWSSLSVEVDDRFIDVILTESLRAQIPPGTWLAAAILSFAWFSDFGP